ncbi:RagB/SusD family nutrient uptake outer membrane protein [Capnocytophaga catalasegens]|uniref:RagB/SusD family nutrient uptake outer membrane protein n=1 Tax=Capnocytophaga catalasegens TaxID=1004260 RepID=A0AAV5AV23_9FLAO|nr:RagB/SusD family nutrient uptake outer membrane protein [Capnocytophaga catalasegens]GIZ14858.1 hypothetical protein RCZ03_08580 [Capnocytophaga catalasegens]GJM49236.1 hypothetical protein RCZ15_02110 [Capnocytophaga catalasegens]GJM52386.1 hypothetical protein RCZ16_07030 [Capnocytophaga catalasegens]
MKIVKYTFGILVVASSLLLTSSCSKDFVETQFFQSEKAGDIKTVEQLTSLTYGIYVKMRGADYLGANYRAYAELHTDEIYSTLESGRFQDEAPYALNKSKAGPENTWQRIYQVVSSANIVINAPNALTWGKSSNPNTIEKEVNRLKGQAYATRALAFFDLLRLYGQKYTSGQLGVVLPLEYKPDALQARATIAETERQIEKDFDEAIKLLGETGDVSDKTQISSWAVKALMSRYYLYKSDMSKVATLVEEIVDSEKYSVIPSGDLEISFTKENTPNSIFELALGLNGALGVTSYDNLANPAGYANLAVVPSVKAIYETRDVRATFIVYDDNKKANFLSKKFSNLKGSSNIKLVRYEEVLLNGAEALVSTDNSKALEYYNLIRKNRGLAATMAVTLEDIKKERLRELIGEGFRYWDLLRWGATIPYYTDEGTADPSKNKNIGDPLLAFPIPQAETDVPNSPIVQNPGY